MATKALALALLLGIFLPSYAENDPELLNLLIMADIGHCREHAELLTSPWPMDKSAFEGAFSLYEGLYDYVTRPTKHRPTGANPNSAIILGDVAYIGGDFKGTEDTRKAFQKYLAGKVPEDRVFVTIGNHDVHFLGCTDMNLGTCYYGKDTSIEWISSFNMSFKQWTNNWVTSFPGMAKPVHTITPLNVGARQSTGKLGPWAPPMRYNLNLDKDSSVYMIAGLNSGSATLQWNEDNDTPLEATDAKSDAAKGVECDFIRDSIAHGRSLGKTIFIYATHDFNAACNDWALMSQIDIWIYGHKHNYWQSAEKGEVIMQEKRHYPAKLLIGNGGFDEGFIDVTSFAHVTEEIVPGHDRVRLSFRIFDTCVSPDDAKCPDSIDSLAAGCWRTCANMTGGFDNGGGPRMATPSKHHYGFAFEAPRKPQVNPAADQAPWGGSWKMQVSNARTGKAVWLVMGLCPWEPEDPWGGSNCIRSTEDESAATTFSFYDAQRDMSGKVSVRLAVDDETRAPLMFGDFDALLYRPGEGFWTVKDEGLGRMRPHQGYMFDFQQADASAKNSGWRLLDVVWDSARNRVFSSDALAVETGGGHFLDVKFTPAVLTPEPSVDTKSLNMLDFALREHPNGVIPELREHSTFV